jgi:ATP-dependent helicase/nuclease subunit A
MSDKKLKWTKQQLRAIAQRESDVLVSASAGTGKTAVLSGRCVGIVSDPSLCPDVRSILVVTFTEMAAEQMRSRIAEQLRDAFAQTKAPHIRKQIMLLQAADISTIHSFCKRLITEHFYQLDLDPTFAVIDADEARLLKAETLERTIDWAWQQPDLRQALPQLLYRRDLRATDGFLATIIELSDFLEGVVRRGRWYDKAAAFAETANDPDSDLANRQKQIIAERLQTAVDQIRHAQKLCQSENADASWSEKWRQDFVGPIVEYLQLLKAGNWRGFSEAIRNNERPRKYYYKPKGLPSVVAETIAGIAKDAKNSFESTSELAVLNPQYLEQVGRSAGLQTKVLVSLVRKFDGLYSQTKRTLNCLDFADLERYALQLLTGEDSSEADLTPSQTALALRDRYEFIFIDEYQDINPVQQAILKMLSTPGNVFVVGDVKQSIYAFRGAEPEIFSKSLSAASVDPANAPYGLRVDLNANFRSVKGVLDFVNTIFCRVMSGSRFAGIEYDESAQLRPALQVETGESADAENTVELHILDETGRDGDTQQGETSADSSTEDLNVITARQRQAAMIAQRIKQMVGAETGKAEFQIYDKEQDRRRDVEYRDIVLLMRSLAKKANDYVEVLRLAGVPVSSQSSAGYFQTTEITDMLCLLKVLDNPQRDIEFAAVLRSPFFNITDTELARIRLHSRSQEHSENFYNSVSSYCTSGPDTQLAEKLKDATARIEQWRTTARRGSLADLVWQIYRQTGYLSFVSALPNGQARRANLLKLHDRAIQFEGFASSSGIPSLSRFVAFVERLQEIGQDWSPAEPENAAGNAVRILSVHKSKGLEFPVVFLAELQSPFNLSDVRADVLADAQDTLGLQIVDPQTNSKLSSLAHQVIAERKLSKSLAEEMRILYVAMTRARQRLILTASQKKKSCRRILCNGFFFESAAISDWQLRRCRNLLDWILYGLSDQRTLHEAFETELAQEARDDSLLHLQVYAREQLNRLSGFVLGLRAAKSSRTQPSQAKPASKQARAKLLAQIKDSLAWQYPFGDAPHLPAKQSVTQLTHHSDEYVRFDYSRALGRRPRAISTAETGLAEPVEARTIGTATHLIISQLDLTKPVTAASIRKTVERLLADGAMSEPVANRVDAESILAFFAGDLGKLALEKRNAVQREWPFTFALPASFVAGDPSLVARLMGHGSRVTDDETIVVQGIIDMLIQTPKGLIVIDFKTDDVTTEQVPQRGEIYRRQLQLYGRAAEAILKRETLARWLYFLTARVSIAV